MAETGVAALPVAEAGSRPTVVFPTDIHDGGVDHEYGNSCVREPEDDPAVSRAQEFLRAPVDRLGIIQIKQGRSRFGPQGIVRRALLLRDLADDGRYLLTPRESAPGDGCRCAADNGSPQHRDRHHRPAIKDERSGHRAAVREQEFR
jgi:hypothetical protein